jgi:transcriptional regulator with XRE-family HTH domain
MSGPATTSRFKTLSEYERRICKRLAERRRSYGFMQDNFSETVGLSRAQLANIESGRVALRFWTGWRVCEKLGINQRWLVTGTLPSSPFIDLDLKAHRLKITESSLFSSICNRELAVDLELRSELSWTIGQYQSSGDALLTDYKEVLAAIVKVYLAKVPAKDRAGVAALFKPEFVSLLKRLPVRNK